MINTNGEPRLGSLIAIVFEHLRHDGKKMRSSTKNVSKDKEPDTKDKVEDQSGMLQLRWIDHPCRR
jgi:hypothetical protein